MKTKFRFPLDLQMFAIGKDGVDDTDIPIVEEKPDDKKPDDPGKKDDEDIDYGGTEEIDIGDDDEDLEEELDDSEKDDTSDEEEKDDSGKDDSAGKNPTAAAVIAERKKWQEKMKALEAKGTLADRLMKQAGVTDTAELERRLDAIEADKLQKQGVSPEAAAAIVSQNRQIAQMQADMRKQKYDGDVERLKKDAFFADIEDHREELESIAERTGLTLEQAYRAVHGDRRMKEREAEIEARVKSNQGKRDSKKVNTANTSGTQKSQGKSHGLTPEQLAAAQHGVKKGIFKNIEEYARLL